MKLLTTTKAGRGRASHSHFIYLNEQAGFGSCSTDAKHSHRVSFSPPQAPSVDSMTGMQLTPEQPGFWFIEPADGHSHEPSEEFSVKKPKKKYDDDLAKENRALFRTAETNESDSRKKAEKSEEFYMGEQWDKADKSKLEAVDRAALTINEIEAKIDLLSGYQRQNRSDFRFFPTEGGDGRVADILNVVVKNIIDQNSYEFEETAVFEDEAITGRGNIHCYLDFTDNMRGDIRIEHFPWKDAYYGPHEKPDASDVEYLIKAKWYSKGRIKNLWPDKAEDIDEDWEAYQQSKDHVTYQKDQYGNSENTKPEIMTSFVNIANKEYRLLEIERKEYRRIPVLSDEGNDYYQNLDGLSEKDISSIETIPDISVVRKPESSVSRTVQAGSVILEKEEETADGDFSLVPVYAKKRGDKWWGKVESVKDPQLEINKRHSQSIDIMNKAAGYGWFYDDTTYANPKDLEDAKKNLSKPGFHLKVQDSNRPPVKQEGAKFPSELTNMMALDSQKIKEIMNINMEMLGMGGQYQSGYALVEQKRQGLIGNEYLFDNLNRSKKRIGKKLVHLIQKAYSPERIMRIVENQNSKTPVQIGQQPLANYDPQEILTLLKTADLTKFDVVVGMSSFNPTTRMANFLIWADLAGKGIQVPPTVLVDMSDLPDKEKVKQEFERMQQQQQAQEKAKMDTEIQKTMIAKNIPVNSQGTVAPA